MPIGGHSIALIRELLIVMLALVYADTELRICTFLPVCRGLVPQVSIRTIIPFS